MTSDDLQLAEATRVLHESAPERVPISGETVPIAHSDAPTATPPHNHSRRIIEWCRAQPIAQTLITSLQQARHRLTAALAFALFLAAILGAGATRTALSGMPAPYANVFLVLLALLGVQVIALLIWAIAFLSTFRSSIRRNPKPASLASPQVSHLSNSISRSHGPDGLHGLAAWFFSAIHPLLRWMARHTSEPAAALAAWQTIRQQFTVNNSGRWFLSALTHSFWLAFNVGALATLLLLLSTRHVTFVWETTLLSEPHYIQLTQYLGALPSRIGFPTPPPHVVADSRWQGPATAIATATPTLTTSSDNSTSGPSGVWSRFILGSLIVYGIIPRAILLLLSVAFYRHNRLNRQLDLSLPFYQTLLTHLEPVARHLPTTATHGDDLSGTRNTEHNTVAPSSPLASSSKLKVGSHTSDRPVGNPAIIGIELPPDLPWPPALSHNTQINWLDLGMIESGMDHRRVLEQLAKHPHSPSDLVVVTDLNITPDRGIERSLRKLHAAALCKPLLVLTGGHALRLRAPNSDSMRSRIDSWTQAATNAGLDPKRILEIDLEHLTEITRQRLLGQVHFLTQNNAGGKSARAAAQVPGEPLDLPIHTGSGTGTLTGKLPIAFNHISEHLRLWLKSIEPSTPTIQQQAALQLDIARLHNAHPTARLAKSRSPLSIPTSILKSMAPGSSDLTDLSPGDLLRRLPDAVQGIQSLLPASIRNQARWGIAGAIAGSVGCLAAAALVHPMALTALPSWSAWGAALGAGANIFRSSASSNSQSQNAAKKTDATNPQFSAALHPPNIMDGIRAAALYAVLLELQGAPEEQITVHLDRIFKDSPENLEPKINPQNPKDTVDAVVAWLETLRSRFAATIAGQVPEAS